MATDEKTAPGTEYTFNFKLDESAGLVNKLINALETTKVDQINTFSQLAGAVRGDTAGVGLGPGLGGSNFSELTKKAEALATQAGVAEKKGQEVQGLAQQILTNITNTVASGKLPAIAGSKIVDVGRSLTAKPFIGDTINPTAQGFKFLPGGRNVAENVSLEVGLDKRKKLQGGELSIEQLTRLGDEGGALSFGKEKIKIAGGTSPADVLKQIASTRVADGLVGLKPTGTNSNLFKSILAAGISGEGSIKDIKKINKDLPESQRLGENKQGLEQLQAIIKELARTVGDSGVRNSSALGVVGSAADGSKVRENRVLPGVGSNLNITDFREYVELQKKLAEAVSIIKTSSKGILDPGTVQRLGAAYQVVKRSLEGEQGVVRLIERLAQAVDTVSNAAPRVAALGSQFKGMLDPLRQADTYLKSIAKSVNEIGTGNINIKINGGGSPSRSGDSGAVAKLPANLDGNLKLVATELAALRTEMASLRTSLAAGRAAGSIARDTGVRKSEAYGFGLSGIQNQRSFSGTDPLFNPKGAIFGTQAKAVGDFNDQVDIAIKRVGLYAAASTGVLAVAQAFQAGAKSIAEVEQRMAQLQFLMNGVRTDLGGLRKEAFAISKEFGFSINQTLDAMVVFAQQGRGMRDTVNLVTTSLAIANQTTLTTVAATEALTAAMSIYGVKAQDSIKIADSWAAVANKNAVSAEVLAGALKKAGGAAVAAGVTFDQLNGFITVINESTRKSGSEIGTSLKYIFQNLAAPETIQLLEKLGVAVYDINGGLRPTIQVFQELNDKLATFSDTQRRQVLVSIASARHYSDLSLLLRDLDKVYRVVGQSQDALGTSAKNNEIVLQTLVKQWQNLKTSFSEVAVEIGSGGLLSATKLLVSGLKGVAAIANLVPDSFKGIITTAAIFAAGMTAITRATNALTGTAFPTVIEKAVAFRTATAAAGVESVKHSSILLRQAAAVNTLATEYTKLAAAQGGASARFAAGGSGVRFSAIATPGGVPGSATPPTTPSAVSGTFRERVGNFASSGAGQLAIAGAGIVGASIFGDAARNARTNANGANTLKSTAFETLQGASAGAAIGVGFGGPTGALVGGVGGGLFGLIGALSDYKTTLQSSLEINKQNLEVFREQISAVEELQTDLERLQNTKNNALTGNVDNSSSVSISPLQTRALVLETLARIGQTDIKSSSTLNSIFAGGGKDASGLTNTRFSNAAYDIAESNEKLASFIVDLKATMEDLKFETAKAADALNKADIEDLRARANIVRAGADSIRFQDPLGITSGTNSIVGKAGVAAGDFVNYFGRNISLGLLGPDNALGNFIRRQGQGSSALGELQSQYNKTGDVRVARVIADLDTVTRVGKKTEEIFEQYRSIVSRAEDPVQSGDLLASFFKTSLSASSIPYSKDVQRAIDNIGEDNVSGFQRFEKRNPLAAREALSIARDTNVRFFNQFYQNRSVGDLSGNLDFQKDFIRRQGLDAAFRPFTRDGIAGASITNATRVGDVFISGKRQEIVTGVNESGIKSIGVRQNELGLLNIERDEDGNVKVFERTREEYARFVETLDKSATVFARVGDSGRSFSGFISNLEKDANQVNKVFGRAQEVLARQFSIINRELDRYRIGGDAGADPRTQSILSARSLAASTDLINRRGLTVSPIDTIELPDTIKSLVGGIGKPETIANALAASTSSEEKLRESIDKLNDTLQAAVFEEVRKANFAKSSVALDAVKVLETQEKQGNLNATTVRKFFGATTIPFTAEEQDKFAKAPAGLTDLARRRLAAIPFDQALAGSRLPGDLGVISNSVSEGLNNNKLGLKELIDRVRDARTVFGVAAKVARSKDLDRVVAQENLKVRREGSGAVIDTENFGEVNLGQFASTGIDASNVDRIEKQFLQFTQLLSNLEDALNSETNKNIATQFSLIEQALTALGGALNKNDLGVQLQNVAKAFTSLSQDSSTTAKLFLQFGASRNVAKDELGRSLSTRGIENDLATRIENANVGPLAGKSRDEVLDLLRASRSIASQRNTGTAIGRAQENIQSFLSKQSVFGLARNDQDVTQNVVSEYKSLVDSLIGERDRLIRDGYDAEAAAIDKLIGKYKELNDKLEAQQRQLSPRRQQFLEAAAKDALAQGGPLLGISDELRGVIASNSRLRQFGVETGALAGLSTKEAAGLKDELAASGDATLQAITELRDKVGEAFGQLPTLDIKFTGIDDLKDQLNKLAADGIQIPVRFRTLDGAAFQNSPNGPFSVPGAASGGKVTRDGVIARLHHGEVVVPSHMRGELPSSITNRLGTIAPQGGVLPMASGGNIGYRRTESRPYYRGEPISRSTRIINSPQILEKLLDGYDPEYNAISVMRLGEFNKTAKGSYFYPLSRSQNKDLNTLIKIDDNPLNAIVGYYNSADYYHTVNDVGYHGYLDVSPRLLYARNKSLAAEALGIKDYPGFVLPNLDNEEANYNAKYQLFRELADEKSTRFDKLRKQARRQLKMDELTNPNTIYNLYRKLGDLTGRFGYIGNDGFDYALGKAANKAGIEQLYIDDEPGTASRREFIDFRKLNPEYGPGLHLNRYTRNIRNSSTLSGGAPKLPKELSASSPRYRNFEIDFDSDIDLAAYTVAQDKGKKNKSHDKFLKFLAENGINETAAIAHGKNVKKNLALLAKQRTNQQKGKIKSVPKLPLKLAPVVRVAPSSSPIVTPATPIPSQPVIPNQIVAPSTVQPTAPGIPMVGTSPNSAATSGSNFLERLQNIRAAASEDVKIMTPTELLLGVEFNATGEFTNPFNGEVGRFAGGRFIPAIEYANAPNFSTPAKIAIGYKENVLPEFENARNFIQKFLEDHPLQKGMLRTIFDTSQNIITPDKYNQLIEAIKTVTKISGSIDSFDTDSILHEKFHKRFYELQKGGYKPLSSITEKLKDLVHDDLKSGKNEFLLKNIAANSGMWDLESDSPNNLFDLGQIIDELAEEYLNEVLTGRLNDDKTFGKYRVDASSLPEDLIEDIGQMVAEDEDGLRKIVATRQLTLSDADAIAAGFKPNNPNKPRGMEVLRAELQQYLVGNPRVNQARKKLNKIFGDLPVDNIQKIEDILKASLSVQMAEQSGETPSLYDNVKSIFSNGRASKFIKKGARFAGVGLAGFVGASALGLIPGLGVFGGLAGGIGLGIGALDLIGKNRLGIGYNKASELMDKTRGFFSKGKITPPDLKELAIDFDSDGVRTRTIDNIIDSFPEPRPVAKISGLEKFLLEKYHTLRNGGNFSDINDPLLVRALKEHGEKPYPGERLNKPQTIKGMLKRAGKRIEKSLSDDGLRYKAEIAARNQAIKNAARDAGLFSRSNGFGAAEALRNARNRSKLSSKFRRGAGLGLNAASSFAISEAGQNVGFTAASIGLPLLSKYLSGEEVTTSDIGSAIGGAAFAQAGFAAGSYGLRLLSSGLGRFANNTTLLGRASLFSKGFLGTFGQALGPIGGALEAYSYGNRLADIRSNDQRSTQAGVAATVVGGGALLGAGVHLGGLGFGNSILGAQLSIGGGAALGLASAVGAGAGIGGVILQSSINQRDIAREESLTQDFFDRASFEAAKNNQTNSRLQNLGAINARLYGGAAGERGGSQLIRSAILNDDQVRRKVALEVLQDAGGRKQVLDLLGIRDEEVAETFFQKYAPNFLGGRQTSKRDVMELASDAGRSRADVFRAVANVAAVSPEFSALASIDVQKYLTKTGALSDYNNAISQDADTKAKSRESYWLAKGIRDFVARGNQFYGRSIPQEKIDEYLKILGESDLNYLNNKGMDSIRNIEPVFHDLLSQFPIVGQDAPPRLRQLQGKLLEYSIMNYGAVPSRALTPQQLAGTENIEAAYYNFDNQLVMEEILRRRQNGMVLDKDNDFLFAKYRAGLSKRALHRGGALEDAMSYFGSGDMDRVAIDQTGRPIVIRTDEMVLPKTSVSAPHQTSSEPGVVQQQQNINVRLGGGFQFINEGGGSLNTDEIAKIIRDNSNEIARKIAEELANKPIAIYG